MNSIDDIEKTTIKLLIKEPFYGHYFTHIRRRVSTKIKGVSVSLTDMGTIVLDVNPKYWEQLTLDTKIGSIKHQILHLIFGHIYMGKGYGSAKLFNIAADLVVNQYISREQLSPDAITLDHYSFLHLEPNESIGYYYKILLENISVCPYGSSNAEGEENDSHLSEGQLGHLEEHGSWESFEKQSGAEKKIIEQKLDSYAQMSALRMNTTEFGSLPEILQTYIKQAEERLNPGINWKRTLRLYMQSSRKTYLKNTLKKPSRRYGTIPGIKIKQKQKILIAIDTSGSINETDLSAFFSEVYHVWKQVAEIMIVLCDVEIHDQYLYKGVTPEIVGGGGGTDFNAPIHFANTYNPDVLLYFTDGYADAPEIKSNVSIIWIISSDGLTTNQWHILPGRKVKLRSNT